MSASHLLSVPRDYEFRGRLFKVAIRDLETELQFVEHVKAEAALSLWRLKATVPADFYREQMEIYNAKLGGREFEWDAPEVYKASWSESGRRHLLWLKMKRGEASGGAACERGLIDEIAKDADKWEELLLILWDQDYPFFAEEYRRKKKADAASSPPPSPAPPEGAASVPAP